MGESYAKKLTSIGVTYHIQKNAYQGLVSSLLDQ